ncbi:unnamed protein product [Fraxinus pennsylvanica]|uniref:Cyclin C-terminal domain-containing protein n=1 Tax=Fraxinus pennsylvanica TaxID=56036 RepID=A0AAD2DIR6_9LAMI|nr:unnamed protein product [Fraxinus pennsylvanica]
MVSHFQEQEFLVQNPIFDALYCEEERFDEVLGGGFDFQSPEIEDSNEIHNKHLVFLFEHDRFWEDDELVTLLSKEKKQVHLSYNEMNSDGSLIMKDKPWMSQLTAVACLSLAAKVEETQVPLLLDLQVEESKYVFEAKTIQRMELLVLSTLKWKMNPVTPISFFDHSLRRFGSMTNLHWEFMRRCESFLLSIITDHRLEHYLPSVIAGATMIYVIREIKPCNAMKYENHLMDVLRISKESIDECSKLIREVIYGDGNKPCLKRKWESVPNSPHGVIDAYFSSDSSRNSWVSSSPVSSSPEPLFKRSRARDQHMRLASLSSVSVGVGSTPH